MDRLEDDPRSPCPKMNNQRFCHPTAKGLLQHETTPQRLDQAHQNPQAYDASPREVPHVGHSPGWKQMMGTNTRVSDTSDEHHPSIFRRERLGEHLRGIATVPCQEFVTPHTGDTLRRAMEFGVGLKIDPETTEQLTHGQSGIGSAHDAFLMARGETRICKQRVLTLARYRRHPGERSDTRGRADGRHASMALSLATTR
jgi:hypothetical protein